MKRLLIVVALLTLPVPGLAQARLARTAAQCTGAPCTIVSSVIAPVVTFEQAFTVERRMTLVTPGSVPFEQTQFTADPLGGILVAFGGAEGTYRRYALDGSVVWEVDRASIRGTISAPTKIARVSETQVLLGQKTNQALIWNELTKRVDRSLTLPVRMGNGSIVGLGGGSLLMELTVEDPSESALHVFDATGRLQRSFFKPFITSLTRPAVEAGLGTVATARRGDTVAVVFAFSDTIYLHSLSGTLLEKVRLPTASFAWPTRAPAGRDLAALSAWEKSVGETTQIFWRQDGSFVVEYQRAVGPNQKRERCFLIVARNGDGVLDLHGFDSTIRIIDAQDRFYFEDPEFKGVRSRMVVARLKGPARN